MGAFLFYLQQTPIPLPAGEAFWPVSFIGWLTATGVAVAAIRWLLGKLLGWNQDAEKWNRAATALEKLSKDVSDLLYEIRGVNGRGGINSRLDAIEKDIADIKERNGEADVLVDLYKADLQVRKERGEPIRRDADRLLEKLNPET